MSMALEQRQELRRKLQAAIIACNTRCLYTAAKWLAEILGSCAQSYGEDEIAVQTEKSSKGHQDVDENVLTNTREEVQYLLAKSLFDCKEYDRCAATILEQGIFRGIASSVPALVSPEPLNARPSVPQSRGNVSYERVQPREGSRKSLFVALYARYIAGEKRRNEDREPLLGPSDNGANFNKELPDILTFLQDYFDARGGLFSLEGSDGWLDYLYGLFLLKSKSEQPAKQWLLRSLNLNPWNWSAWLDLASMVDSQDDLEQLSPHLPQNIMTFFFHIYCSQELLQQNVQMLQTISQLLSLFPRSAFLQQQKAIMHYHAREHDLAVQAFETLIKDHPYRVEGLEIYSNLLYILADRPKLAALASRLATIDKFRSETNCVLGNFYSLSSEHEKAVLHFRRALALDRNFQIAWTLMGHEYIELKNTQAAIESYRRAVDINRKDFRAWYGLGQGYEMLECFSYSLFYYQRAAALCPGDPKMWSAVGNAYANCNKGHHAIQAYKRALIVGSHVDQKFDMEGIDHDPLAQAVGGALDPQTLYDIAILYERDGLEEEASAYMELTLAQEDSVEDGAEGMGVTQITSRARLWLARWAYGRKDWQRAMTLANELCQDGIEVEEAKALVKDVRARIMSDTVKIASTLD